MNGIRYSASADTQALRKGNWWIGTGDVNKGPTQVTGYWVSITPPVGGYSVYINRPGGGPAIYNPGNDADLITVTRNLSGTTFATGPSALNWYNTQTEYLCMNIDYPTITTNGLVFNLDAGFTPSYPRGGTSWYDVGPSGNNGALVNGPIYGASGGGSIIFDGTDDAAVFGNSPLSSSTNSLSFNFWVYPGGTSSASQSILGKDTNVGAVPHLLIRRTSNTTLTWNYYTGSSSQTMGFGNYFLDKLNSWINVGLTANYTTGLISVYINGYLFGTSNMGTAVFPNTTSTLFLSSFVSAGFLPWTGNIAVAQIYNRILSSTEILQSYQSFFPRFLGTNLVTSGLVLLLDAGYSGSYTGTGSTWYDSSGYGNNTSLLNGAAYGSTGANYFSFDGVDDYGLISTNVGMGNPTTVCVLFNRTFATGGNQVFFGPTSNGSDNWISISNNTLQLYATEIIDVNNFSIAGTTSISTNRWYYATGIINGQTATLYLNGSQEATVTKSFNIASWTGTVRIGTRGSGQFPFTGKINAVQAYNRALSQSEILQNYYNASIVTSGLVFAVDAGNLVSYESGTTTTYSQQGTISGTLTNGVGYSSANGGVWTFDGIDDRIPLGYQSTMNNLDITQEAWVNASSFSGGWLGIISNMPSWGTGFSLQIGTTQKIAAMVSGNYLTTSWTPSINQWYHIVATHRSSDDLNVLYVNGVQENTLTRPISYSANAVTTIGVFYTVNQLPFAGKMGPVRTYNRALTAAEVQQNFNAQKLRFGF